MKTLILILALSTLPAHAKPKSNLENGGCKVKGSSVHWMLAYCMAQAETEDESNENVQKCVNDPAVDVAGAHPCKVNEILKRKYCKELANHGQKDTPLFKDQCLKGKSLPTVVEKGGG